MRTGSRILLFGIGAATAAAGGLFLASPRLLAQTSGQQSTALYKLEAIPNTPANVRLVNATMNGDLSGVKAALAEGASADARAKSPGQTETFPVAILASQTLEDQRPKFLPIFQTIVKQAKEVNAADSRSGMTLLMAAVDMGDLDSTKDLVGRGADVNARMTKFMAGQTALHMAISYRGMLERSLTPVTAYLLDHKADANLADERGRTPLHIAAQYGKADVVKALLAHGADPSLRDSTGKNALAYAGMRGGPETVALLRDRTPVTLWEAARFGKVDEVKKALASGGDPNGLDEVGTPALCRAAIEGQVEVAKVLLAKGANVNLGDRDGRTALHIATAYGRTAFMALLLDHGANIDAVSKNSPDLRMATPLQEAIVNNQPEAVDLLLRRGAKVSVGDEGSRPLDLAARHAGQAPPIRREGAVRRGSEDEMLNGQDRIFSRLLAVTNVPRDGGTALYFAAYNGQTGLMELLLKKGANVNSRGPSQGEDRKTALMAAMEAWGGADSEADMMKSGELAGPSSADVKEAGDRGKNGFEMLLARHADVNLASGTGETPLMESITWEKPSLTRRLIALGAKVDASNEGGQTALMQAVSENMIASTKELLAAKANINLQDNEGMTALMLAIDNGENDRMREIREKTSYGQPQPPVRREDLPNQDGHPAMVKLLLQHGANVNLKNAKGETALSLAKKEGFTQVAALLKAAGAK